MVLVHQVVPHLLCSCVSLGEFQTNDLRLTTHRRLEVDVLHAPGVKNGVSLCRLPLANEGPGKANESPPVKDAQHVAASSLLQPSVGLPPV